MSQAILASFSLLQVAESKVGDDLIRGISGGERKRLSIAEAFIGGSPLQCWDNSTRGLDSSTAVKFTQLLRTSARTADTTAIVSVYQASQAIYDVQVPLKTICLSSNAHKSIRFLTKSHFYMTAVKFTSAMSTLQRNSFLILALFVPSRPQQPIF